MLEKSKTPRIADVKSGCHKAAQSPWIVSGPLIKFLWIEIVVTKRLSAVGAKVRGNIELEPNEAKTQKT